MKTKNYELVILDSFLGIYETIIEISNVNNANVIYDINSFPVECFLIINDNIKIRIPCDFVELIEMESDKND